MIDKNINVKEDIIKILGKNIKQLRLLKGFTQDALAAKLNKSVNLISLVERRRVWFEYPKYY